MSDIFDDPKVLEGAFEDLADELNEEWERSREAHDLSFVTLLTPGPQMVLQSYDFTVSRHMYTFLGGEDFEPHSCYVDRQDIVVRFAPRDASPFKAMIMDADSALQHMEGFSLVAQTHRGPYDQRVERLRAAALKHRERAQVNAKRAEAYKDLDQGFGTF